MPAPGPEAVTRLLADWSRGNASALDELVPIVHGELRKLAQSYMRREAPGHTLQPTALINEAYLRLADQKVSWQSRAHFFGVASRLMRQILVDYARSRRADKRGGNQPIVSIDDAPEVATGDVAALIALDDALKSLAAIDERKSRVIELRYFGGLTIEETATVLGVSHTTVEKDWTLARAWLRRELSDEARHV